MLLLSFCQLQPNLLQLLLHIIDPLVLLIMALILTVVGGGFVVASITTTKTLIMVLDIMDTMVLITTICSRGIGMAVGFQALNSGPIHSLLGVSFVIVLVTQHLNALSLQVMNNRPMLTLLLAMSLWKVLWIGF